MQETEMILQTLQGVSYGGIFVLSLMANLIIPVPEEIVLLVLGYIVSASALQFWLVLVIVFVGLSISDMVLFTLSRRGGKIVAGLHKRMQKFSILQDTNFIEKHIKKIIFISRFVVQFRFIGPVLAGTSNIPRKTFLLWNSLALMVYVPLVLSLGIYFQNNIEKLIHGAGVFRNYVFFAVMVLLVIFVARLIKKSFIKKFLSAETYTEFVGTAIPGFFKKRKKD
jgi:membrane protein DedA with SNARE-associated domain